MDVTAIVIILIIIYFIRLDEKNSNGPKGH